MISQRKNIFSTLRLRKSNGTKTFCQTTSEQKICHRNMVTASTVYKCTIAENTNQAQVILSQTT